MAAWKPAPQLLGSEYTACGQSRRDCPSGCDAARTSETFRHTLYMTCGHRSQISGSALAQGKRTASRNGTAKSFPDQHLSPVAQPRHRLSAYPGTHCANCARREAARRSHCRHAHRDACIPTAAKLQHEQLLAARPKCCLSRRPRALRSATRSLVRRQGNASLQLSRSRSAFPGKQVRLALSPPAGKEAAWQVKPVS